MKHLHITWGDIVLYDGPAERLSWTESGSGAIKLEAGPERSSGGLFAQLAKPKPPAVPAATATGE